MELDDDGSFPRSDALVNLSDPSATSAVTRPESGVADDDDDWAPRRQTRPPRPRHTRRHRKKPPVRPQHAHVVPCAAAPAAAPTAASASGDSGDSPTSAVMPSTRRVSISATEVDDDYDGNTTDWLSDYSESQIGGGRYTDVLEQLVKVDSCHACKCATCGTGAAHVTVEMGKADGGGGVGRGLGAGMTEEEKAEKKRKAKVKDYMKTALSSERTFFKWMFAGLQFGALGTLLFVSFRDEGGFPVRLILVFVAWSLGLGSSLYGLLQYHRRRQALNADDPDPARWESPRAPMVLVAAFFLLVLTVLVYAIATRQHQPPPPWSPSLGGKSEGVR